MQNKKEINMHAIKKNIYVLNKFRKKVICANLKTDSIFNVTSTPITQER